MPPEASAAVEFKTNGAHVAVPASASNGVASSAPRQPPAVPTSAPAPSGPPVKSWASLLKTKPAPPPAPAPPKPAPPVVAPAPPEIAPAEPEPESEPEQHEETAPTPDAPEPEAELHETHVGEKDPELKEELGSESLQGPTSQPQEPVTVVEEPVTKPATPIPPPAAPAFAEHVPPAPAPPQHAPPGLNLVTQQAPFSEPAIQPTVSAPSRSTPAPVAPKPVVPHRTSARYPKSDQAVVMPSGFEDIVTGVAGFSFGQFGDEAGEDGVDHPR